jgi:hypothetical protein
MATTKSPSFGPSTLARRKAGFFSAEEKPVKRRGTEDVNGECFF